LPHLGSKTPFTVPSAYDVSIVQGLHEQWRRYSGYRSKFIDLLGNFVGQAFSQRQRLKDTFSACGSLVNEVLSS
jgi:hypothetical protein